MSRLILLANFVASWDPHRSARPAKAEYIRNKLEIGSVHTLPNGWVLGIKPLPRTAVDEVFLQREGLVVLQGGRTMAASTPAGAHELGTMADRMRHRPHDLGQHVGDFALVLLDANGQCTMVNTPAALPPLYFARDGETVTLASRLDWIAALRPVPAKVDRLPLALWSITTPLHLDGRTIVRGITRMPRSSHLRMDPGIAAKTTDLADAFLGEPASERSATRKEVALALRRAVLHSLETELIPDGHNLLSLSGGMDSSALASVVRGMGRPFKAVSLLSSHPQVRARELIYIRSALGPKYPGDWLEIPWLHREYQTEVLDKAPPILHPVLHPVLCELPDIQRQHPVEVYFGGEFCDELIGGASVVPEWCGDTPILQAWRETPVRLQGRTISFWVYIQERLRSALGGIPPSLRNELPGYIDASLRLEYRDWLNRFRSTASTLAANLPLLRWQQIYTPLFDMNWEAASSLSVRRSFPIVSRDTLALLRRTAPALRLGPGPKELFRAAFAKNVPEINLNRDDKGVWGTAVPLVPRPPQVLRSGLAKGIIRNAGVAPYSLLPGTGMYALRVTQRYMHRIRTTLGIAMKSQDIAAKQPKAETHSETRNTALDYVPPRFQRGGNLSTVTQGNFITGDPTTGGGSAV